MSHDKDHAENLLDRALVELTNEGENWSRNGYYLTPDDSLGWTTTVVNLDTKEEVAVKFSLNEVTDWVKANMDRATIDAIKQQIRKGKSTH